MKSTNKLLYCLHINIINSLDDLWIFFINWHIITNIIHTQHMLEWHGFWWAGDFDRDYTQIETQFRVLQSTGTPWIILKSPILFDTSRRLSYHVFGGDICLSVSGTWWQPGQQENGTTLSPVYHWQSLTRLSGFSPQFFLMNRLMYFTLEHRDQLKNCFLLTRVRGKTVKFICVEVSFSYIKSFEVNIYIFIIGVCWSGCLLTLVRFAVGYFSQ